VISRVKLTYSLIFLGLMAILSSPLSYASSKEEDEAKAGAALYRDKGCAYCHGVGGVGTKKAPALTDVWKDKSLTTEKMTNQILNGGQKMPPFRDSVTDEEVTQLISYLRAKKKPEPPPTESDAIPAPSPQ